MGQGEEIHFDVGLTSLGLFWTCILGGTQTVQMWIEVCNQLPDSTNKLSCQHSSHAPDTGIHDHMLHACHSPKGPAGHSQG